MTKAVLFLIAILAATLHAEIVDRMVAVVDGRVITWSAAVAEANYQAFQRGADPVSTLEGEPLQGVVSRIVDQELLQLEMIHSPFTPPTGDSADRAREGIRQRFATPAAYGDALQRYGLSEAGMVRRSNTEQVIISFVDSRLRPQAIVSRQMIEDYYTRTLVPQVVGQGQAQAPSLEEVGSRIEQILTEREINRMLDEWIKELRTRASIKIIL